MMHHTCHILLVVLSMLPRVSIALLGCPSSVLRCSNTQLIELPFHGEMLQALLDGRSVMTSLFLNVLVVYLLLLFHERDSLLTLCLRLLLSLTFVLFMMSCELHGYFKQSHSYFTKFRIIQMHLRQLARLKNTCYILIPC